MTTLIDIGPQLVAARTARGLSQRALGELLGVKQQQVARWEASAYRSASLERVTSVAEALGVDVSAAPQPLLVAEPVAQYGVALPGSDPEALSALARTGASTQALAAFARSHGISQLELFGSVLTDAFRPDSDVDLLATYDPNRTPSLLDAADHEAELSGIFRRRVDLVSRAGVEASGNVSRKREILGSARTLYARP
jgi:predicted nucleotidyltransferase/DNA-binding XRE family transcriptional regulator